jgi:hypothetical protein
VEIPKGAGGNAKKEDTSPDPISQQSTAMDQIKQVEVEEFRQSSPTKMFMMN